MKGKVISSGYIYKQSREEIEDMKDFKNLMKL